MPTESVLFWVGGKQSLSSYIVNKMPPHKRYVETFLGAANIFLNKPASDFSILNDLNGSLVSLWKVMQNDAQVRLLKELFRHCVYSRELWEYFYTVYKDIGLWTQYDDVTRAFMFIYINRVSYNGMMRNYSKSDTARNLYELYPIIDGVFYKFQSARAVVENLSFKDLLESKSRGLVYDEEGTFIYGDPPYWITTEAKGRKYYEEVMSPKEHEDYADLMLRHKNAKWLISYDNVPKVLEMYGLQQETEMEFKSVHNNVVAILTPKKFQSSSVKPKEYEMDTVTKSELLIANYPLKEVNTLFE